MCIQDFVQGSVYVYQKLSIKAEFYVARTQRQTKMTVLYPNEIINHVPHKISVLPSELEAELAAECFTLSYLPLSLSIFPHELWLVCQDTNTYKVEPIL